MRFVLVFVFIVILFVSSCMPAYDIHVTKKSTEFLNTVALYNTMIGEVKLPTSPKREARVFSDDFERIRSLIREIQCNHVNTFRDTIAKYLKKHLDCDIIYKDSLFLNPGFKKLRSSAVHFEDSSAINPYLCLASGELTSFDFEKDYLWSYLKDTSKSKPIIKEICRQLNVDILAISFSYFSHHDYCNTGYVKLGSGTRIPLEAPGSVSASVAIKTTIYFFNKSGDLLLYGSRFSRYFNAKAYDIDPYEKALREIPFAIDGLMKQATPKLKETMKK